MRGTRFVVPLPVVLVVGVALLLASARSAEEEDPPPLLRVGTSGDYAPFSVAEGPDYVGLDVELARRFAQDEGMELRFVRFRWGELLGDLARDRFDVAWSGITMRPERSAAGRFGPPTAETGAVVLVAEDTHYGLDDLDRPHIRIGVNAGGHLERVARRRFSRATLLAIPDNAAVIEALREGAVRAVVTDSAEALTWMEQVEGLTRLGPFTWDRKAPLVHPDRQALAVRLDAWILAREADGSLAALRREHLGGDAKATADPLSALLAAVDERLALMPLVGVVKRETGVPIEVPEREGVVLDAATGAVLEAARAAEREPPEASRVRAFFRAQMDAAKQIQTDAVKDPESAPAEPWPDLDLALRPALLRIGEKIAPLLLSLPPAGEGSAEHVRERTRTLLREPLLARSSRRGIAGALVALLPEPEADQERTKERTNSPATTGITTQTP